MRLGWRSGGDDEAAAIFEAAVLESESVVVYGQAVEGYLRIRGERAKPFFEKFSAAFRETVGEDPDSYSRSLAGSFDSNTTYFLYELSESGGADGFLRKLEALVKPPDAQQVLGEMADGTLPIDTGLGILGELFREKPKEHVLALLQAAGAAQNGANRTEILGGIGTLLLGEPNESLIVPEGGKDWLVEGNEELWSQLIEDGSATGESYWGGSTIGGLAAMLLEGRGTDRQQFRALFALLGEDISDLFLERARSRIAGEDPGPLPDAARVGADRRQEIRRQAVKTDAPGYLALIQELSWDELLAWSEMVQDWEGRPLKVLEELAVMITEVPADLPEAFAEWQVGTTLTRELLETTLENLKKDIETMAGSEWNLSTVRRALGGGLALRSIDQDWVEYFRSQLMGEDRNWEEGAVVLWTSVEGSWENAMWPPTHGEEQQERVLQAIEQSLEGGEPLTLSILIHTEESLSTLLEEEEEDDY